MFNHGLGDLPDDIWRYIHAPCFKWYLGIFLKRLILQKQVIDHHSLSLTHPEESHQLATHTHTSTSFTQRANRKNLAESGRIRPTPSPLNVIPPVHTPLQPMDWAWRQQACRWFSYVSCITCQCRGGGLTQSMCYTCSVWCALPSHRHRCGWHSYVS